MEKKFYLNIFLLQPALAAIKLAINRTPTILFKSSPGFYGTAFNFNKQKPSGNAYSIAPVFYKVFNPLTAAWFK